MELIFLLSILFLFVSVNNIILVFASVLALLLLRNKILPKTMVVLLFVSFILFIFNLKQIANSIILVNLAIVFSYYATQYFDKKSIYRKTVTTKFVAMIIVIVSVFILLNEDLITVNDKIQIPYIPNIHSSWFYKNINDNSFLNSFDTYFGEYSNVTCGVNETTISASCPVGENFVVFDGCDTQEFCEIISKRKLEDLASEKNVVLTPVFMQSLMNSGCSDKVEDYIENFKRSGSIYDSSGRTICLLDELQMVPIGNKGIVLAANSSYGDIKNYAMAFLLDANFDISSLENPFKFLDLISFPRPCNLAYESFVGAVEFEYRNKYEPNIIDMSKEEGVLIEKPLTLKPNYRYLPLIKALELGNNTYVCSAK